MVHGKGKTRGRRSSTFLEARKFVGERRSGLDNLCTRLNAGPSKDPAGLVESRVGEL